MPSKPSNLIQINAWSRPLRHPRTGVCVLKTYTLYLRDGRGVRLTPTGEQLAAYAARLRDSWRDAFAFRDALRGLDSGTLRIGASTTPASYLLPYLVAAFHRRFPGVKLETTSGNTSDVVGMLGTFDIALIEGAAGTPLPPDTIVHPWHDDEIVAIVPRAHPLTAQALAPDIRVNAVGPGPTLRNPRQSEADFARQRDATILKHGAEPTDVADAVRYLLEAEAVTGQMLAVDGGQHLIWQTPDVLGSE